MKTAYKFIRAGRKSINLLSVTALTGLIFPAVPAFPAGIIPALGNGSISAYGAGSADNYGFKMTDPDGNTQYYSIKFDVDKMSDLSSSGRVAWSETEPSGKSGYVEVQLPYENIPDGRTETLYYKVDGVSDIRISNPSSPVNNKVFYGGRIGIASYASAGLAIYNTGNGKANVSADFIDNAASTPNSSGGAVFNSGQLGSITGNFSGNSVCGNGGAINNRRSIGDVTGNFIGNHADRYAGNTSGAGGGAVYNYDTIGNITGDFIGNYASLNGGAVYNFYKTGDIKGDFIGNYTSSSDGGAIYNKALIPGYGSTGNITGNFIGNHADNGSGGAIFNSDSAVGKNGTGGIINSFFIGNYAKSSSFAVQGGAIWTNQNLNIIADNGVSVFDGNYIQSGNGEKDYQAVWIDSVRAKLSLKQINGGKMYMHDGINGRSGYNVDITGDGSGTYYMLNDIKNAAVTVQNTSVSTANNNIREYNLKTLASDTSSKWTIDADVAEATADTFKTQEASDGRVTLAEFNFVNDNIRDYINREVKIQILKTQNDSLQLADGLKKENGKSILQYKEEATVKNIKPEIHWSDEFGNYKKATKISGDFNLDKTDTDKDSARIKITNVDTEEIPVSKIDSLYALNTMQTPEKRTFTASNTGEVYTVKENSGKTASGSLTVSGTKGSSVDFAGFKGFELDNKDTTLTIENTEVKNSSALVSGNASENVKTVLDGVNLHDNGRGITTAGSVDVKGRSDISDNITVTNDGSKVTLDGTDTLGLDGKITGTGSSALKISNGTVNLKENALLTNSASAISDVTINIAKEEVFRNTGTAFTGESVLNAGNGRTGELALGKVDLGGKVRMLADVDLANLRMDTLSSPDAVKGENGVIEVEKLNLLSPTDEKSVSVLFTKNKVLADSVLYTGEDTVVYSPVYKYKTSYYTESSNGYGYFRFGLAGSDSSYSSFNPAATVAPVAAQTGGYLNQLHMYDTAFGNFDMKLLPDTAKLPSDRICNNADGCKYEAETKPALWVKPYAEYETADLRHGPDVKDRLYGAYFGIDSKMLQYDSGWKNQYRIFGGYNGLYQTFDGNTIYQNGGSLGAAGFWYKGSFFTALTAGASVSFAHARTNEGREDFPVYSGGISSRTGYNFAASANRFYIQPNYTMSYTFVRAADYKNASGIKINSGFMNTVTVSPGVKFIGNLQNGWQPYGIVREVWTLGDKTDFSAGGIELPDMSVRPYAEYGAGLQRRWNKNLTGFAQVMFRSGGREGVALGAGLRYAF